MTRKQISLKETLGYVLLLYGLYMLVRTIGFCFSPDIWYDEVFSVGLMKYSYKEIMEFTAKDVHPPLYYWYLKTMVSAGQWLHPGGSPVVYAKLASALPMVGLFVLGITKVRKEFGIFISGAFVFCVYSMPQIYSYGMEIRMYSLALLLVTLTFFSAYECYRNRKAADFVSLVVFGLLTAYTQYFACVAIGILYLMLGAGICRERQALKKWGIAVFATVFGFLPWVPALLRQFTSVQSSYWIPLLTWRSIGGCVKYIFLPLGGYPKLNFCLAVLLIAAAAILFLLFLRQRGCWKQWFTGEGFALLLAFGMLGGTILIGVGISILVSPMFVYRYLIPCLGGFWFVFALCLGRCDRKALWIPILLVLLYTGHTNYQGVEWEETKKIEQMKETLEELAQIADEDVLVFNFNHLQAVVGYYKENESYLLYGEAEAMIRELYREYGSLREAEEVVSLLKEGRRVWFLGSFNSREEIVEEWRQQGLRVKECGSYLLERYWFNLYEISYPMEEYYKSTEDDKGVQIIALKG